MDICGIYTCVTEVLTCHREHFSDTGESETRCCWCGSMRTLLLFVNIHITPSDYGCSLAGIAGLNPTGLMDVYCQVEVSATDRSLVQRSSTDCAYHCV